MHVYSTPITPPPTTIKVLGNSGICRIWSLLMMLWPLMGTVSDTAGLVPVAIMIMGASRSACPREVTTRMCVASRKLARAKINFHAVAGKLRLGNIDFGLNHLVDPRPQVRHGDLFFDFVVDAVDALGIGTRKDAAPLPAWSCWESSPCLMQAPAHDLALLDHHHPMAELRPLNSRPLSGRSGADYDEVVYLHLCTWGEPAGPPRLTLPITSPTSRR